MGTLPTPSIMIKTLLASALLALTAAEADPQLLYGAGLPYAAGVPYVGATVGAVAHVPVVKSDVVTPAEVEHEVTAHPVAVAVGYYGYGYRGYRGYYGSPYGYRYGYYGKRSADADPAVLPAVTYAAHPLAYHAGLPLA